MAGTPYIIKWTADANYVDDDAHNIVNPVLNGVTIDATDRKFTSESGDTQVRFMGTYKSTTYTDEDKSILFLGGTNTLYYPESGATIGACRAYFKIGDGDALARQLTAFNLDFGDSSESTGIREIDTDPAPSPSPTGVGRSAWYTLDGRKLDGKPTKSGVYIRDGKKVVIK